MVRGTIPLRVECAPAFNYAQDPHDTKIVVDDSIPSHYPRQDKVIFASRPAVGTNASAGNNQIPQSTTSPLTLDLRFVSESLLDNVAVPDVSMETLDLNAKGHLGLAVHTELTLVEGQRVTFVLRIAPEHTGDGGSGRDGEQAEVLGVNFEGEKLPIIACWIDGYGAQSSWAVQTSCGRRTIRC